MGKVAVNTKPTAKPRGKPWPKGTSGNLAGAPKRGESWAELIKRIGDMTPAEAADYCKAIAGQLRSIGTNVTLKEAVTLRVYAALLFDPQPGLLNTFMERTEGKVSQAFTVEPSQALMARLQELGLTLSDVRSDPLAAELFQLAGIDVTEPAAGTTGSGETH